MSLHTTSATATRLLRAKHVSFTTYHKLPRIQPYSTSVLGQNDVVIVGGGPAGLALASALSSTKVVRDSLKITLVEAGDLSKVKDWNLDSNSYSNRVSSITDSSQTFLQDIGVWNHVDITRTNPIHQMQVWDGMSDARITFDTSESGASGTPESTPMANMTENLNLQRALLRYLSHSSTVRLLDRVKVVSIDREDKEGGLGWPLVHLSNGTTLRTRLLVGADGFNSPVRSYAGISSYGWAYDTQAIVATLNHPERSQFELPNNTAYQRFLPTGPIAFLPLSPTTSSLVWSTEPRLASTLTKADPAVLASLINAAFRLPEVSVRYLHDSILDAHNADKPLSHSQIMEEIAWREHSHAITRHSAYNSTSSVVSERGVPPDDSGSLPPLVTSIQPGTIASFPLRYNHTDSYIGEGVGSRTVLIGDAAHTVHPLAGQGLNLGLADVEALARCINSTVMQGGDIGSYTALLPYARERYFENHKVMSAVDKLHKLYSSTVEPVVWARSVGLEVLNELDSVKTALMMNAGAYGRKRNLGSGWDVVASGFSLATGVVNATKIIGGGMTGLLGAGLQSLSKTLNQTNSK